ncbi:lipopolysaccharide biosynthesis glycosyltransferase [Ureibacillus xyleni]|uniref:Lipopolysaccharide biosynthesis glycosyltransferase n=1 Tax=Ureibacillus xyleni TaxID=614648 RepID=A0A285RAL4_9BACL|nr:glycosyltransferase family 8 protein [Ureibacillus xyleni]SOB91153.1 lipopolysaccharide biosynthesis glycosyltransferase [Ureibacillus xyleni]
MEKIHIVLAPDNNYVVPACAVITSVLENNTSGSSIHFYILDNDISNENKKNLDMAIKKNNLTSLSYLQINSSLIEGKVVNGHISEAAYYRILLPQILFEIKKVIYLDCDVIVKKDIKQLWDINIDDYAIAAVGIKDFSHSSIIGLPSDAPYFNSGVMLMNLKKWREENLLEKVLNFIRNNPDKLLLWDQDALNAVLYNNWLELDIKWNVRTVIFTLDKGMLKLSSGELQDIRHNPYIIHYTTESKPWHFLNNHPLKKEFFEYLDKSGISYIKYPEEKVLKSKIILFGTGRNSENITKLLNEYNFPVFTYLDNNKENHGKLFLNREVLNPEMFEKTNDSYIIIASQYYNEISIQLQNKGLIKNKDYFCSLHDITKISQNSNH